MSLKERNYSTMRAARATRIARSPSPLNVAGRPGKKQKNSSAARAARVAKIPRSPSPCSVARILIRERKSRPARLADIARPPSHPNVRRMSASPSEAGEASSTTTLDNDFETFPDRLSSEQAAGFESPSSRGSSQQTCIASPARYRRNERSQALCRWPL